MIQTVFRSDDLRQQERLTRFDEFQLDSPHPMRVTSDTPAEFTATARALDLGGVDVVELTSSPIRVHRTAKLVREHDPELCSVLVPVRGRIGIAQAGREAELRPHEFALYDSSHPFTVAIDADDPTAALVRVQFPKCLLSLPTRQVDNLLAVPLPAGGVGALLTQFLIGLTADAGYRPADLPRLSGVTVDLVEAAIAHHADAEALVSPEARQRTQLHRIEAFIRRHLPDPELGPGSIAAAHHISVSYLHRLFQRHSTTVAAWIREQRLEQARRDLDDPAQRRLPVHRIATRWGFNDHSTFTRAFRDVYGLPPTEYRLAQPARPNEASIAAS